MKNNNLFLYVLILSFIILSFGYKSASAANCASGDLFNSVTGQACSTINTPTACTQGDLFNILTGQPCSVSNTKTNNSSAVTQFNNLFNNFSFEKTDSNVKSLQQFLKDQGYYFGKIDGRYGRISARAVSDFRADNNIGITVTTTPNSNPIITQTQPPVSTPTTEVNGPKITIVSAPQSVVVGQQVTFSFSSTNPKNLNLGWNGISRGSSSSCGQPAGDKSTYTFCRSWNTAGSYPVTVSVSDNFNSASGTFDPWSDSVSFIVNVSNATTPNNYN